MQAVILAAGMGKRLKELTSNATKCMVEVNGVTMISRALNQLDRLGLNKIVMVVGYEGEKLKEYVRTIPIKTPVEFIENDIYYKTNNIYSLYLAREALLEDDTLLLESDLIFEDSVLDKIVNDPYPSLALVAKFESWMDGTVVTLDDEGNIKSFLGKKEFVFEDIKTYYKTVNIYKFSKNFSRSHYVPFLEAYCKALGHNEYYEQVLKVITHLEKPEIKALCLDNELWYEIDDVQDLDIAESIFASEDEKLQKMQKRYGGYWRYPHLVDFCYLVNPFYPSQKLINEIKANFETLLCEYPSGMYVNSLLAAKYYGLRQNQVCVGNGAAELIKSLMGFIDGKLGMVMPTFEEYPNRKGKDNVVPFYPKAKDLRYTAQDLMDFYGDKDISILTVINPDNPSGNFIPREDVLKLAKWCEEKKITLIIDESFVDFADTEEESTLLDLDTILGYPEMIVVKSISKSFGVPGLRLGIMASGNKELIKKIQQDVSIWNINSFGEFYLQIFEKYKSDYQSAMKKFIEVRKNFVADLEKIDNLIVYPSEANYLLCELKEPYTATELTKNLLNKYSLFIKDLTTKKGLEGRQCIRLAVRTQEDNDKLIAALKEELK